MMKNLLWISENCSAGKQTLCFHGSSSDPDEWTSP